MDKEEVLNSTDIKKHMKCYLCKYVDWSNFLYNICSIKDPIGAIYTTKYGWHYIEKCYSFEEDWVKILRYGTRDRKI